MNLSSFSAHGATAAVPQHPAVRPTLRFSFIVATLLAPGFVLACACGCGVFDVGTAAMIMTHPGGMLYLEDDYQSQDQNWVGSHAAPAANNTDKEIQTNFGGVGLDYAFNRDWTISVKIPYWDRLFRTDIGSPGAPDVQDYSHSALGDIRVAWYLHGNLARHVDGTLVGSQIADGRLDVP